MANPISDPFTTTIIDPILVNDITSLPADDLARYVDLLRDGSPAAIAEAATIWRGAFTDAACIRESRRQIARIQEADRQSSHNDKGLPRIEQERSELVAEIERLQTRLVEIDHQVSRLQNHNHQPVQFRRELHHMLNPAARRVLADELAAIGF